MLRLEFYVEIAKSQILDYTNQNDSTPPILGINARFQTQKLIKYIE